MKKYVNLKKTNQFSTQDTFMT